MPHRAVYKGKSIEDLDQFYRSGDAGEQLGHVRDLLAGVSEQPLDAAAAQFADEGSIAPEAVREFQDGWLADESPLGGHDVDRVMRFGYQQAIELAAGFDPPAPIESHWVTGAGEEFELHIVADPHLVTVLIFIPADRDYGSTRATSRSFVVRVGDLESVDPEAPRLQLDDAEDPVFQIQVSGPFGSTEGAKSVE